MPHKAEKLTDIAIKNAVPGMPPKLGARQSARPNSPYKLSDGRGLYLLVLPTGPKLWRVNTRLHRKQRTFELGAYPGARGPQAHLITGSVEASYLYQVMQYALDPAAQR